MRLIEGDVENLAYFWIIGEYKSRPDRLICRMRKKKKEKKDNER